MSITSIANITSLVSIIENMENGKRVQYWLENPAIINDIPIPAVGIIETYKNNIGNRAEQIFKCTIANTDKIYYRYIEWNGINWGSPFGWKEIATKSDYVKVGNVDSNGNISINEISSSRKIISISRSGFIIIPFVYADYWVAHCFNLDMTPVVAGVQLELNITYI